MIYAEQLQSGLVICWVMATMEHTNADGTQKPNSIDKIHTLTIVTP